MRLLLSGHGAVSTILLWLTVFLGLCIPSQAVLLPTFTNCMAASLQTDTPKQLQWVPAAVSVVYNASASYNLNITVYGNVTGQRFQEPLPAWDSPIWNDANFTNGKIRDFDPAMANVQGHRVATLFSTFNVLNYVPYNPLGVPFCTTTNRPCPIGPIFNSTGLDDLNTFSIAPNMENSYGFTSLHAYLHFVDDRTPQFPLGCVVADITPYIGSTVSALLTYIPLAILVLVAIATASAAIFSPWGTWDVFQCTTNYGRDADLLRLITPGFGDCLHYIQFIFFSGSLTLNYPGFFQPVTSSVGWSALMFNQSFVTRNTTSGDLGPTGLIDGIYVVNSTRGLQGMSQLIGLANDRNIWVGMVIWLLVIVSAVLVIIQAGFLIRWIYRRVSNTREEDLRAKNFPFSAGNVIRIAFNYFFLPLVAISMYELLIAGIAIREMSSVIPVAFAAITLIVVIIFIVWIFRVITRANPRSSLFDDLPTVLLYGPLYNTYSDNAAAFALIPLILLFIRGVAIGAIQSSGIAQLVVLIICEVFLILTLNAFRPFSSPTSMNAYHTIFSVVRLIILLLMICFIPALGVDDAPRGWIAYVILFLHGMVLLIGFFLHSLQTLVEVVARSLGAGDDQGTATRGGLVKVFGVRQLSRRLPRDGRTSMASSAAMLAVNGHDKRHSTLRSRSVSASSNLLLGRGGMSDRHSVALDSAAGGAALSQIASSAAPYTPTGGPTTPYSYLQGSGNTGARLSGIINIRAADPVDPWFRQPRPKKTAAEVQSPGSHSHGSMSSGDWQKVTADDPDTPDAMDNRDSWITPLPAHLGNLRERSGSNPDESVRPKPDYATREVDYYYGVRGPALSHAPTRRLKTGPADPTGPVSSATGWFKGFFGGKTKEKGKGFEVVRSSRMPPPGPMDEGDIALEEQGPYHDSPGGVAVTPSKRRTLALEDEGDAVGGGTRRPPSNRISPVQSDDEGAADEGEISDDEGRKHRVMIEPPLLDVDTGDAFEVKMPSRYASKASSRPSRHNTVSRNEPLPALPRKSSRRNGSNGSPSDFNRLPVLPQSPSASLKPQHLTPDTAVQRMPFVAVDGSSSQHNRNVSGISGSVTSALTESSHARGSLGDDAPPLPYVERPSSLGFVQQHRASDGLHLRSHEDQFHVGSTAELVNDATVRQPGTSTSTNF